MNYIGTIAIGGIIGYYVGAKELLGIQSTVTAPRGGTETEEPEDPTPEKVMFLDEFSDETFENQWSYVEGKRDEDTEVIESGTTLRHDSPANYGPNEPIQTDQTFETSGTHRIVMSAKTNQPDYNGWGISLMGENRRITLRNNKWEGFDRFIIGGVTGRPDEYSSDYDAYGEQTNKAKLGPATSATSLQTFSLTVDFDTNTVTKAQRGSRTWDLALEIQDIGPSYRLSIPAGGGHDVEYDMVKITSVESN